MRSANKRRLVDFYKTLLEAEETFGDDNASFLTYDEEHHRIAVIGIPGLRPNSRRRAGVDHIAFTYASLGDLLATCWRPTAACRMRASCRSGPRIMALPWKSGLEYAYNAYGYLLSASEAADSSVTRHTYYTTTGMDARGNVTGRNKAGLAVSRTFDARTGLPDRFTAKTAPMSTVHDLDFTFDVVGNLTAKRDRSRRAPVPMGGATHKDLAETYCYDSLHRLMSVHGSATTCATGADRTLALTYDALGNIKSKRAYKDGMNGTRVADANADVGTYTYGAGSPATRDSTRSGSCT